MLGLPAIAQAQPAKSCFDATVPLTVEEQRLTAPLPGGTVPVGPELVRLAGFDALVDDFTEELCSTSTSRRAQRLATTAGDGLWQTAVDRAQGRRPDLGTSDTYDDRPLYWARLQMSKALRQWTPRFAVDRTGLLKSFDEGSRGIDSVKFPLGSLTRRVLVSGFDPFQLNGSGVRISNPAGASALQLDGKVLKTANGPAIVQAVSFPVVWGYFDQGIVEAAYGTALKARGRQPDVLVTISQGRPSQFDIERWASAWRGGVPDNNNVGVRGQVPVAAGWPQPDVQFIETTLPYQRMIDGGSGTYPVNFNRSFCVWSDSAKPGTGPQICRTDEPKTGEMAASGGGGDYLSNESMYRSNRVRLGLGATDVAGGHLHTPVLGTPGDPAALTDAAFEARRRAIADQAVGLVKAAVA
ncbi:hypothetical protein [Amycolatopsis sp.]|jgi:hypothetical protein|uniref:hypothetical protein n=1 Tax=Amycolatopsis sp. TaxID=37632 RepID=UPI002E07746A|nr:hypothetical protein [Amycolatopsis sp.]